MKYALLALCDDELGFVCLLLLLLLLLLLEEPTYLVLVPLHLHQPALQHDIVAVAQRVPAIVEGHFQKGRLLAVAGAHCESKHVPFVVCLFKGPPHFYVLYAQTGEVFHTPKGTLTNKMCAEYP